MKLRGQAAIKSPSATARRMHGQAAMEFLMTYGWAIIIMLSVVGILFYVGIIRPTPPNSCTLPPGFSCSSYKIEGGGNFSVIIGQSVGQDIVVTNLSCSAVDGATASDLASNVTIKNGRSSTLNTVVMCKNSDGTYPGRGDYYSGKILIKYTELDTGIDHQISGNIVYTAE